MKRFIFDIDVVGICNLRCPSCPQGMVGEYRPPAGSMDPELLRRVISKARSECEMERISLFSWGEPMLHPQLPELIRVVHEAGITCYLSSNLNILRNADAIMAENPAFFRISASGFSQDVYGYSHRGGNIERVKRHMVELAEAKRRNNATTRIHVYYHRYRHNLREEPLLREFAAGLGFDFEPVWALIFPVERILSLAEGDATHLSEDDRHLIENLVLPPREALEVTRAYRTEPCPLRDAAVSLDFQGNVQLCCGIFDSRKFTIGNYLELPLDEIQRQRENHGMCVRCMEQGAHVYLSHGAHEFDELAVRNVRPEEATLLGLRRELAIKRLKRRLGNVYRRFFSGIVTSGQIAALEKRFDRMVSRSGR